MDFIVGLLGGEANQGAGAGGDMAKNPAAQQGQAQQAGGASSFQQLMQQVMQMNNSMPNMAQQAMQQAQKQTQPNNGWAQLLM